MDDEEEANSYDSDEASKQIFTEFLFFLVSVWKKDIILKMTTHQIIVRLLLSVFSFLVERGLCGILL